MQIRKAWECCGEGLMKYVRDCERRLGDAVRGCCSYIKRLDREDSGLTPGGESMLENREAFEIPRAIYISSCGGFGVIDDAVASVLQAAWRPSRRNALYSTNTNCL